MSTATFPPSSIRLQRPWWQRLIAEWQVAHERRARRNAERDADRDVQAALAGLSEGTLRDIGAPEWIHETDRSAQLRWLERAHW